MVMLLVDNDDCFCRDLVNSLKSIDNQILIANDQVNALRLIAQHKPGKVVLEQYLVSGCGLELIEPILKLDKSIKIIMLSRYGCIADAVKAVKLGVFNYLPKPVDAATLAQSFESQLNSNDASQQEKSKPMTIKRFEWEYITTVLATKKGNISATARELGLDRRTLQRKLKKYPCFD